MTRTLFVGERSADSIVRLLRLFVRKLLRTRLSIGGDSR